MTSKPDGLHEESPAPSDGAPTRAGYVTLVGRPNAGKSTLVNALIGQTLSIVTAKAQTTWERVSAIDTRGNVQMILLDTPGLLEPRDLLQRSMLAEAREALREADVILAVVDASSATHGSLAILRTHLEEAADVPRVVAVNKIDASEPGRVEAVTEWAVREAAAQPFAVSALRGTGLSPLRSALEDALPESPFLYSADDIATRPTRYFVAELVRETVFQRFHQEIPYSVICRVEEFREAQQPIYVGVTLFVEKPSQKPILVGKGGSAIRELGRASREKIEHFLGQSVYLDLWVKVLPGWRRKRTHLAQLGFHVPEGDDVERR